MARLATRLDHLCANENLCIVGNSRRRRSGCTKPISYRRWPGPAAWHPLPSPRGASDGGIHPEHMRPDRQRAWVRRAQQHVRLSLYPLSPLHRQYGPREQTSVADGLRPDCASMGEGMRPKDRRGCFVAVTPGRGGSRMRLRGPGATFRSAAKHPKAIATRDAKGGAPACGGASC